MDKYRECILNIDWNALNVYEDCDTYYKHFIDKFKIQIQSSESKTGTEIDSLGSLQV